MCAGVVSWQDQSCSSRPMQGTGLHCFVLLLPRQEKVGACFCEATAVARSGLLCISLPVLSFRPVWVNTSVLQRRHCVLASQGLLLHLGALCSYRKLSSPDSHHPATVWGSIYGPAMSYFIGMLLQGVCWVCRGALMFIPHNHGRPGLEEGPGLSSDASAESDAAQLHQRCVMTVENRRICHHQ